MDDDVSDAMKQVIAEQKKTGWNGSSTGAADTKDPMAGQPKFIQDTLKDLKPLESGQTK